MRRNILIIWSVVVALLLAGEYKGQEAGDDFEALLAGLTLEQKVAQMMMVSFYGQPLNEPARDFLATYQPGAVVLFPSNIGDPAQVTAFTNAIQETLTAAGGLPALIAVDQEGGIIAHLKDGFTEWPVPMLLAATQSPELAYSVGEAMAAELRAVGVHMNLAPVADLNTNPRNPIIGRRAFGSIPERVAPIVTAYAQGLQGGGVLATVKHFPGHGDTTEDSHVALPVVPHDRARLETVEWVPFRAAFNGGAGAVMVGHLVMPALDPTPNMPASLSAAVVTGVLRDEMGYAGLIMTDALDMDAIDTVYSTAEAALLAVRAGHDLIALGAHVSPQAQAAAIERVAAAVRDGDLDEARIDASVRRILEAKARYDVLQWQPLDPTTAAQRIPTADHAVLVERVFAGGITVLGNASGLLPAQDGALLIYPASQPSLWRACTATGAPFEPLGVSGTPRAEEIAWARDAAARADRVIVFVSDAANDPQQAALVTALPPEKTAVVALWSPYDILAVPPTAASVLMYSPLRQGYAPVCRIMAGEQPASGQIPITLHAD